MGMGVGVVVLVLVLVDVLVPLAAALGVLMVVVMFVIVVVMMVLVIVDVLGVIVHCPVTSCRILYMCILYHVRKAPWYNWHRRRLPRRGEAVAPYI
jgi:hypothetical protein